MKWIWIYRLNRIWATNLSIQIQNDYYDNCFFFLNVNLCALTEINIFNQLKKKEMSVSFDIYYGYISFFTRPNCLKPRWCVTLVVDKRH